VLNEYNEKTECYIVQVCRKDVSVVVEIIQLEPVHSLVTFLLT
jgi:hypothetical protein